MHEEVAKWRAVCLPQELAIFRELSIYNVVRYFIKAAHPCATQKVPARLQILIYRRPTWSVQLGLVGTLYVMYLQVPPGIKNILGFLDLTTKLYQ